MLPTASLHRYPYVRLLAPWIAGIFCGDRFFDRPTGLYLPVFLFVLFAVLSVGCHFLKRHTLRWCFGLSVTMLCFAGDRKSTRLNSSHANISYAVFCLKKKKTSKF